jgi:hypothetical protein
MQKYIMWTNVFYDVKINGGYVIKDLELKVSPIFMALPIMVQQYTHNKKL